MTFAVTVKVDDGVVLAADSASSLTTGVGVLKVYKNANKIFNLHRSHPVALITWGGGSIGNASVASLVKDFRLDLEHDGRSRDYTMEALAIRLRDYLLDRYRIAFEGWAEKPYIGFLLAGYSSPKGPDIEQVGFDLVNDEPLAPVYLSRPGDFANLWRGQLEPVGRLLNGVSHFLPQVLTQTLGVDEQNAAQATQVIIEHTKVQLASSAMPIQDAIDLAEYLVDLTVRWSRFAPGAQMVDGPIDIAVITKHEGFKWIQRKMFYQQSLQSPSAI